MNGRSLSPFLQYLSTFFIPIRLQKTRCYTSRIKSLEPARPELFNYCFAADRKFKDKFERLKETKRSGETSRRKQAKRRCQWSRRRRKVQRPLAEILEQALDVALEKKDPKRKLERRKARQKATKAKPRLDEMSENVAPGMEDESKRRSMPRGGRRSSLRTKPASCVKQEPGVIRSDHVPEIGCDLSESSTDRSSFVAGRLF